MDNTTVDKLANPGKRSNTNEQGNIDNGGNVIVVENLVEVKVTEKDKMTCPHMRRNLQK